MGIDHLPLQLDPGHGLDPGFWLVDPPAHQDWQHPLHHYLTEYQRSLGLCGQSTAVNIVHRQVYDNTIVVGLISKNNKSAYREEVEQFAEWCRDNNLSLYAENSNYYWLQKNLPPHTNRATMKSSVCTLQRTSPGPSWSILIPYL